MKYGEKKAGTSRENPFLKQVYVLLGGYAEENYVVPVQLEVKEMEDQSENRLYLSVVLTKIAPEVLEKALSGKPGSIPRLFSDAKISIADIFRNVNRSLPTWGAWIEIEVESREPSAEVSAATRRTQDSDGNEKAARRGGKRASIDRYSYRGKSMTENSEIYSYDFLTHQPDMKVVELPALSEVQTGGRINREKIVADGIKNAEERGEKLSDATAAVKNKYSGRNVIITKAAIKHSMGAENPSRLRTNARIGAICGDVIENALPINALKNENPEALGTYAMVAILQSGTRQIAAMVTVEQHTDKVTKIDTIDLAHALNGRIAKKEGSESSTWEPGYANSVLPSNTTFGLSIADVIRIVNTTHQSILSDDVLKALGEERNPEGYYAQRAKFSSGQQTDEKYNLGRSPDGKRELKS